MLIDNDSLTRLENKPYHQYNIDYIRYCNEDKIDLIKEYYKTRTGKNLNLDNPNSYNEKLQWLKIFWRDDLVFKCVDKISSKQIVSDMGCNNIVETPLAVFNSAAEIDLSILPNSFVMKPNNSSGCNLFVKHKNIINPVRVKKVFEKILNVHYYSLKLEWGYDNITPKIICEPLMEHQPERPLDYKFYCFHGKVKFVEILTAHNWNYQDEPQELIVNKHFKRLPFSYSFKNTLKANKSADFDKMVQYAEILAKPFPHVRIDLYNPSDGIIRFGEFTFFPSAGYGLFDPVETDLYIGQWLNLSLIKTDI